jgi:hypothetical protein
VVGLCVDWGEGEVMGMGRGDVVERGCRATRDLCAFLLIPCSLVRLLA